MHFVLLTPSISHGQVLQNYSVFFIRFLLCNNIIFRFDYFQDGMLFLRGIGQKQMTMIFAEFVKHISNAAVPIVPSQEINVL